MAPRAHADSPHAPTLPFTRRRFLKTGLAGTAAVGASGALAGSLLSQIGCAPQPAIVRGACHHDCPDACAWLVTIEDNQAIALQGDPAHPVTRGALCPRMDGFIDDVVYNPDRLLHPLKRVGPKGEGRFERVGWDQALDEVAGRLQTILAESGPTAVLPYSYYGTEGIVQAESIDRRFFARLGATRLERNVCGSAGSEGLAATMGTYQGILPDDVIHSRFILIWGANPVVTNPHNWTLIEEARRSGAKIVVIDPMRTRTAQKADIHLAIKPGTDTALALGMMHVIIQEDLHDADYVARYTLGFDRLAERAAAFTPERVARMTGLTAEQIVDLARRYATTRPSVIRLLIGLEHHHNGGMTYRTIACLPGLTGAWRDLGGGLLHFTWDLFSRCLDFDAASMPELEDASIRSVNMVQLGSALTNAEMDPPIRALIVYNSNPATIAPNQNLVVEGLRREDLLTVVLDHFVTDTARYADYVFPATTQFEHLDLMASWGERYLALNMPAIAPLGESAPNSEFFRRLARRLGFAEDYLYESDEQIIRRVLAKKHRFLEGITYEQLRRDGWAPLRIEQPFLPFAEGEFQTPSGRCEFYADGQVAAGLDPLPAVETERQGKDGAAAYPLVLLSPKSTETFLNSSHANQRRQLAAAGEAFLDMHEADAAERGIAHGEWVRVLNGRGSVEVRARVENLVREGVVALPHGWWASLMPGGSSANALTPDGLSDLGGGGDFHDARVEVKRSTDVS